MVVQANELDSYKPWINDKIKKIIKEKEDCFNKWKKDKSNDALKKNVQEM